MAEETGDKSLDATPHRREQARKQGQVAVSQDLASAALLLGSLTILMFSAKGLIDFLAKLLAGQLADDAWLMADRDFVLTRWQTILAGLSGAMLPILGMMLGLGIVTRLMQTGLLLVPSKLAPDMNNINPLSGLQRLFSLSNAVRLGFGIFKVIVVGGVAFVSVYQRRNEVLGLTALDVAEIASFTWDLCLWTGIKIGIALLILGMFDYGYQWWKHEQDLKMTTQEAREELRNLQGDPQIIARRKQTQRQLGLPRVSGAVSKADVVITDPTELAVAIRYDAETMHSPIVVAKGAGVIAVHIRKLALENGVPIVEKKPLAQALFQDVDTNQPIPDQLYAAVAEMLAYVYQLKGQRPPGVA